MKTTVVWPPPASDGMKIRWSDGWWDQFDESEFAEECRDRPRKALVYKKGQTPRLVEYALTVSGMTAEVNYGAAFAARNDAAEWDVGCLRIRFRGDSRTEVSSLHWRGEGQQKFWELNVGCTWLRGAPIRFDLGGPDTRRRASGPAVLRPGQLRFRETLRTAFGGRCCFTGFDVWDALEAAHIEPYFGENSDHVQNGLLMRADLHRLFDRHLVSVHPSSMTIRVAASLRSHPEYGSLHGQRVRVPRRPADRPSGEALAAHHSRFTGRARES